MVTQWFWGLRLSQRAQTLPRGRVTEMDSGPEVGKKILVLVREW